MRVLVAIDELGTSAQTLAMARLLCAHFALDVTLLASAPSAAIAERLLVRAVDGFALARPRHLLQLAAIGTADDAVRQTCQPGAFDLLIIAPAGRRGLSRMLHGSRVANVVRHAPCSVLIPRGAASSIQHILVGVSAALHSEIDVRFAAHLARGFAAAVTALHVISQLPLVTDAESFGPQSLERFLAAETIEATTLRRALQIFQQTGVAGQLAVRDGLVQRELIAAITAGRYDLLVVGAHVAEGREFRMLDDITDHVVREAPVSTLVVRTAPDWNDF